MNYTHLILIRDGAPYHRSKATEAFFGKHSCLITVNRLPAYSPDCNPIGKLWKKTEEKETHLHYFPTFRDLGNKADEALLRFENMQEEILSLFGFYNRLPRKKTVGLTINSEIRKNIFLKAI